MYIIEIIPIQRGIPFDMLSYYHKDPVPVGSIVEAPFKSGTLFGIVLASKSLVEMRSEVRGSRFNFKKITRVVNSSSLFTDIASMITTISNTLCVPNGAIARLCLPEILLQHIHIKELSQQLKSHDDTFFHIDVCIEKKDERTALHKRTIRECLSKKKSVIFVTPTIREAEEWALILATGIEERIEVLHSEKKKKDIATFYKKMEDSATAGVFIVTPQYFAIPRNDIGAIIGESQNSPFYISRDRFNVDMRLCMEQYAILKKVHLIWGTTLPTFDLLATAKTTIPRHLTPENIEIVHIEKQTGTLPREIIELIAYCVHHKKKLFIYTNQKGFAPISMCRDCHSILECDHCKLPLKLSYKDKKDRESGRQFVCTNCERTYPIETNCALCQSWNISPFSIGSDALYTEILEYVDPDHTYIVDNTHSPDEKTIQSYIQKSENQDYGIFIGTKKILPYLPSFDYCVIPFFDRLIQIPSYTTVEDMLDIVLTMSEKSTDKMIICTRNPELALIEQLQNKKLQQLIADELDIREKLEYPPYATLHKITITVPKIKELLILQAFTDFFASLDIKASVQIKPEKTDFGQKIIAQCILKTTDTYIQEHAEEIKDFLLGLPWGYSIERNPRRLL